MRNDGERETRMARLYDAHFDSIFRYLLIRTGNVAEAEDLTSQTFFKALRAFSRLRWLGGSESAWLYRIATNELNSHFRRVRTRSRLETRTSPADEAVVRERDTAEEVLHREEVFVKLAEALRGLAPLEQALVVLRYFERKSYAEIAGILRTREGTLAMRTHRALKKMRVELEKRGVDHEGIRESFARRAASGPACGGVPANVAP